MHQPEELSLSQVQQQLEEYESFIKTTLFQAFCEDFDTMAAASIVHIVDNDGLDFKHLVNREQVIGEARIQRLARNWFVDAYDELKDKEKTLKTAQQLTEDESENNE